MNYDRFVNPNNHYHTDQDIEYFHLIIKFPHASLHKPSFNSLEMRSYIQVDSVSWIKKSNAWIPAEGMEVMAVGIICFSIIYELSFPQKGLPHLKALLFPPVIPYLCPLFLLSQFIIMYLLVCVCVCVCKYMYI